MKILKYGLIGLVALIAIGLGVGLCMPSEWRVERSLEMNARPEAIHPLVADLKVWPTWMPWMEEDPTMPIAFEGEAGAVGSKMSWNSEKIGTGTMTVTKSDAAAGIEYELMMAEFSVPAKGSIAYAPEGAGTRVTWTDTGSIGKNPIGRLFRPLIEAMLATYFDRGLANLKKLAEAKG